MPPTTRSHGSRPKPTLLICGATSFTARVLLTYLDTHPDSHSFEFILVGRNASKLDEANSALRTKRETLVVRLEDEGEVERMVQRGDVVLNLAGPFRWYHAETIIRQCAQQGKHYVDVCGEGAWLAKHILPNYDFTASKTGAVIVPSCGFDSVPSDLTLYLAHKTLRSWLPGASISSSISFFDIRNASFSGGSLASMLSIADLPREQTRVGEYGLTWRLRSSSIWTVRALRFLAPVYTYTVSPLPLTSPQSANALALALTHDALLASCDTPLTLSSAPLCPPKRPSTPARFVWTLTSPGLGQTLYGAFFVMWPFNRIIVRRTQYLSRCLEARLPSGDLTTADEVPLESIPVPTQGKGTTGIHSPEPVYGEEIEYAETWQKGSYLSALLFSLAQVVFFGVFFGSRVLRKIILHFLPQQGSGAPLEQMEKGWYRVTNISRSDSPAVEIKTTFEGQGDPGYINTCYRDIIPSRDSCCQTSFYTSFTSSSHERAQRPTARLNPGRSSLAIANPPADLLAESALSLVLPPPEGTSLPPLAKRGGMLTPATAMGSVLVERLQRTGKVHIHSEILTPPEDKKRV
ncbi:hypothetical protein EHS25_009759 [Saitozyma podzolica]|uniref:Saccharopine dehydrogenase NADP binding domain-containing protein n=1 Tax=Saitozyma podzolica TaxID=1890683 RepID=A0A427YK64_9TREE|nr:hypothetical protein EHS25_009759 [Saitozyma podzolica]